MWPARRENGAEISVGFPHEEGLESAELASIATLCVHGPIRRAGAYSSETVGARRKPNLMSLLR